jgi:hypothetical protein
LKAGSLITNEREPRSCLGWVFNFKLGSFYWYHQNFAACKWPLLKLKTQPRFCPVSWSLSVLKDSISFFKKKLFYVFSWNSLFCQIKAEKRKGKVRSSRSQPHFTFFLNSIFFPFFDSSSKLWVTAFDAFLQHTKKKCFLCYVHLEGQGSIL